MEVKPELKHRPRTYHNHRSRDNYKGKNCWKYALESTGFDPLVGSDGFDPL
jgi:hypothetical protein